MGLAWEGGISSEGEHKARHGISEPKTFLWPIHAKTLIGLHLPPCLMV